MHKCQMMITEIKHKKEKKNELNNKKGLLR